MDSLCIVDGFCGAGGASLGIEMALGVSPTIGLNHDEDAIAVHAINHPSTIHFEQDIYMVRPEVATGGRSPYCAWFSPDCTHRESGRYTQQVSCRGIDSADNHVSHGCAATPVAVTHGGRVRAHGGAR